MSVHLTKEMQQKHSWVYSISENAFRLTFSNPRFLMIVFLGLFLNCWIWMHNSKQISKISGTCRTGNILPTGTFSQVVINLGLLLLITLPISEAHVSPAEHAKAPKRDKHIHDAVYCFEKSIGISPGPFSIIYKTASSVGTPPLQNTWTQFLCPPKVTKT